MIKNKYKSDYQAAPRLDARGRIRTDYYYTGEYYCIPLDEAGKKKAAVHNFLFGGSMLLIAVLAGMLNPESSRTAWIVFPYIFLYLPCAYMMFGAYAFTGAKLKMEKACYDGSIVRMMRSCRGVIILSILNVILDVIYMILHFDTLNKMKEFGYCGCLAAIAVIGIAYGMYFDRTYMPVTIESTQ